MRTSWDRTVAAAALAAVAMAGCAPSGPGAAPSASAPGPDVPSTTDAPTPSPTPTTTPTDDASTRSMAAGQDYDDRPAPNGVHPTRLRIPAIGVDAKVSDMGLNDDGSIEVPEVFADTGWWTYSPEPGRIGTSAILGHVDSRTGPAVFYRLRDLEAGDEIHVDGEDGDTVTFVVRDVEQYAKDEFPSDRVLGASPDPQLRLITCGGAFDSNAGSYLDNVVAYADLEV